MLSPTTPGDGDGDRDGGLHGAEKPAPGFNPGLGWVTDKGEKLPSPAFASTIQFIVKKAVNGGPALAEVHFKGPGGMNGLLNASRTTTDMMVIGFAPPSPVGVKRKLVETRNNAAFLSGKAPNLLPPGLDEEATTSEDSASENARSAVDTEIRT